MGLLIIVLAIIAAIAVLNVILKMWYPLFPFLFIKLGLRKNLMKLCGDANWAVVTGGTDGIGKSYAKQLAQRGFNVFLISRTQSKLDETAKEIQTLCPEREVKTLAFDFTRSSEQGSLDIIRDTIQSLNVGILVNNVGMAYGCVQYFDQVRVERIQDVVVVNCLATTLMTHMVIPQMRARKRGVVVNVSSVSGLTPIPFLSVYSATKSYLDYFSQCLHHEYSKEGIIIQGTYPSLIATKMSGIKKGGFMNPDADTYVSQAIDTIGLASMTTGYFMHALLIVCMRFFPIFIIKAFGINLLKRTKLKWSRSSNQLQTLKK